MDLQVPTLDGQSRYRFRRAPVRPGAAPAVRAYAGAAVPPGLLVTVEVVVPSELSKEARSALESFSEATGPAPRRYLEERAGTGEGARRDRGR